MTQQQTRLSRLRTSMVQAELEAILLVPGPNLTYLTGQRWHVGERLILAAITPERLLWLVPELEEPRAAELLGPGDRPFTYRDQDGPRRAARALGQALGGRGQRLGIEPLHLRVFELHALEAALAPRALVDAQGLLSRLRSVKDAEELAALRRAVDLTQVVLQATIASLRPGQSEREVALHFQRLALDHGATPSFTPIVAAGEHAGNPHALPGERALREGDVVTLDVGVWVDGYPGDITRNVALGALDPRLEEVFGVVREANRAGIGAAGPGVPAQEVDRAARQVIERAGYGECFLHRTGHGLGLEVHEPPFIVAGNAEPLRPGNVFTVEPGVYLEGLGGIRVEDDVVVTAEGVEVLTTFSRDLVRVQI